MTDSTRSTGRGRRMHALGAAVRTLGVRTLGVLALGFLALGVAVLTTGGQRAAAATGPNRLTHVYIDLMNPPRSNQEQYDAFLRSLRDAVSVRIAHNDGVVAAETQLQDTGLVQASLSAPNNQGGRNRVELWINPSNLYLWGFSNQAGTTWQFHDSPLQPRLRQTTNPRPPVNPDAVRTLTFDSVYTSIQSVADIDRQRLPISYGEIRDAISWLGTVTDPESRANRPRTARSLMLMIQVTSEAARLNPVAQAVHAAMDGRTRQQLSAGQAETENSWSRLSRLWHTIWTGNPAATIDIPDVGTVGRNNIQRYVYLFQQSAGSL